MTEPIAFLANAVFARWALAGSGSAVDMQERIDVDRSFARVGGYGDSFFTVQTQEAIGILIVFLVIFFTIAAGLVSGRRS